MIEYLRGDLADLTPTQAVVDCGGVGYAASISLYTYTAIQGKKSCKLYVYEAIREDAYQLYGFSTRQERELFLLLISVPGIGGGTARMILSALSPSELIGAISQENATLLKAVKGIGLKTAQRIIVDLKDKIKAMGGSPFGLSGTLDPSNPAFDPSALDPSDPSSAKLADLRSQASAAVQVQEEAIAALTMLGFQPQPSQKVVLAILREDPTAHVEQVIKLALKRL